METQISVGIGQLRVARSPSRLICVGLGSCVAIAIWDSSTKMGGMAHVMLPDESYAPKRIDSPPAKFGNTAAKALADEMKKAGANVYVAVAKIAGGANMFRNVSPTMKDFGLENAEAIKKSLKQIHIRLIAEDIGGSLGRTVELDLDTGKLSIKNVRGMIKQI
jgi:chemotaxis protein CheD